MVGLEESILVGTELLKLGFEKFLFVICDLFLVEDKNIRDIVVVNLGRSSERNIRNLKGETLPCLLDP